MNKLEMNHQTAEIVREAVRKGEITQTASVMSHIPELLSAVEIDSEYMRKRVENELNRKTGNPINAVLGLMGMRIVRTKNAAKSLGLAEEDIFTVRTDKNNRGAESMLKINKNALGSVSEKMVQKLADVEKTAREDRQKSRDDISKVFAELDKATRECSQLSADLAGQRNAIMERAQYMLSLMGEQSAESEIGRQIIEMLEDIGVIVYWTSENAPFADSAMFTELKCDDPQQHHMKPCLASSDAVLIKGIRFAANE